MAKAPSRKVVGTDDELMALVRAIATRDDAETSRRLASGPTLAKRAFASGARRESPTSHFLVAILHYIYQGDTALHIAAAAYNLRAVRDLITLGAPISAANRRGAQPIHYAADGGPHFSTWDPVAQEATVRALLEAGANPNALDKSGVAPLHRAVRTRCSGAVRALLAGGADPRLKNKSGSTPLDLANQTTGRGGSGSAEAKTEQADIVRQIVACSSKR
jgi:Ankyrin repeats (many copies)